MAIGDIPILSMLRTRLDWAQQRQQVLSQNVANADTPNYRPRDITPLKFDERDSAPAVPQVMLTQTESGHLPGVGLSASPFRNKKSDQYEIRPSGNAVNMEEEMMKVAANQMDYQAATALYTHSLNLLKTALGKR